MFARLVPRLQPQLLSKRVLTARYPMLTTTPIYHQTPMQIIKRNYVIVHRERKRTSNKVSFLYACCIMVAIYFVANRVDKKKPPQQSFTEREFQLYEEETGLKRRNKLISHAMNSKYKFYVIPYVHDEEELKKWLICYNTRMKTQR